MFNNLPNLDRNEERRKKEKNNDLDVAFFISFFICSNVGYNILINKNLIIFFIFTYKRKLLIMVIRLRKILLFHNFESKSD